MLGGLERSSRPAVLSAALAVMALVCLGLGACLDRAPERGDVPPQAWWSERGPVVPHDSFPADCSLCHTSEAWHELRADFRFDHLAQTGVGLNGAHARAECLRCHNDRGPVAQFAARGCRGCHEDIHRGDLGPQCSDCHSETSWVPQGQVAEHERTRFPLTGAHAATACFACHEGAQVGNFQGTPLDCVSCHRSDFEQTTDPDHAAQGFSTECQQCHSTLGWSGSAFQHTIFPLTGGHAGASCAQCHTGGAFKGTSTSCASCHEDDYDATTSPDHVAAGFSLQCAQCHTTAPGWPAVFDHSKFPLTGGHAGLGCTQCHPLGKYKDTPTSCAACHQNDYNATTNPNHTAAGFSKSCQQCHSTYAWVPAAFNHSFPIDSGKHKKLSCAECHVVPGNTTIFSCIACHAHEPRVTDGKHVNVAGYAYDSAACLACHPNGK
jgi:hypothetical protein